MADVCPAGRSGELESERIGVRGCPFSDDVGDDASVMLGCDIEGAADGPAQVDAVHPRITGEADVVEVAKRLPQSFVESEEWQGADWCWHPASET